MSRSAAKPFKLHAGHPALELVNTLDLRFSDRPPAPHPPDRPPAHPVELLPTYLDLLRLTGQMGLVPADQARKLGRTVDQQVGQRVLALVIELREALAAVLYAWMDGNKPPAGQMEVLQRQFQAAAAHRHLAGGKSQLVWSWAGCEQQAELPLWKLAQSAADLLVSPDARRIKACGDPACRWLFLDLSKNHTRRWCDMQTCGNRMKARRFQARRQENPV